MYARCMPARHRGTATRGEGPGPGAAAGERRPWVCCCYGIGGWLASEGWLPVLGTLRRLRGLTGRRLTGRRLAARRRQVRRGLLVRRLARHLRVDLPRRRLARRHRRRGRLAVHRSDGAERHLRDRPDLSVLDLEVTGLLELEHPGDQVRRERLDPGVVVTDIGVVETPAGGDPVLGVGQLALQAQEVLVRLQLRVRLDRDHHLPQRAGQRRLGLGPLLGRRALGTLCLGPQPGDLLEHVPLMRRIGPHGLDQVRDQVVPAVQLDVDLAPRLLDQVPLLDEPVVRHDQCDRDDHDQRDDRDDDVRHKTDS